MSGSLLERAGIYLELFSFSGRVCLQKGKIKRASFEKGL
jgi:hypothetical protein